VGAKGKDREKRRLRDTYRRKMGEDERRGKRLSPWMQTGKAGETGKGGKGGKLRKTG